MTNDKKLTFYHPNIREIMSYVVSGQMNFTQAIESLETTVGDFEELMIEYFNKDKVLPAAAFAMDKLFPHHNASVKNGHEHGTVNKTLLKFQIARIKDSKVPIDIKFRAIAHLMGHAKVIFPQSKFVQENLAIQQSMSNGVNISGEISAYVVVGDDALLVDGITEESDGHTHSYMCVMTEDGNCEGETRAVSNGDEHRHSFSGKMKKDGTMQTGGPNKGDDHKHMIDFNKKKDHINKSMPGTMEHKIEPEQKYREIKLGRMKIFLRK